MKNQRHLSLHDAMRLNQLVERLQHFDDAQIDIAEELQDIVATALIASDRPLARDRVAMNSKVSYRLEEMNAAPVTITLAYPEEVDTQSGRISILTPIALALLGRRNGQVLSVVLPVNREVRLRIESVETNAEELIREAES